MASAKNASPGERQIAEKRNSTNRNVLRLNAAQLQPGKSEENNKIAKQITEERLADRQDSKRQVKKIRQKPQDGDHLLTKQAEDQPERFDLGQHAQTFD